MVEKFAFKIYAAVWFSCAVKTNPCFWYEGKTGNQHNLVIFKYITMNNNINGELSARPFIDMVVDRFIFKKNNQSTLSPCFTFIPKADVGVQ